MDAAQSAGVLPVDMEADGIDYLCVAPHKGLYAPMGTGLLLCRERDKIPPLVRGGTGSYSVQAVQPPDLPDRLESGTPNTAGICGIRAGLRFVREKGRERIYAHEIALLQRVYDRLASPPGIRVYTPRPAVGRTAPVLSLNVVGLPSEQTAALLNEQGIAVRAGLHCAPLAHTRFGTMPQGTVRLAPSAFSTPQEVKKIGDIFSKIAKKSLHSGKNMI